MKNLTDCTEAEMRAFIAAYPRKLESDVNGCHEPPLVAWHDFTRGDDSIVAAYLAGDDPKATEPYYGPAKGFQILAEP